ncbi:MAG: hypothetical protein DLM73_08720 [Chthoniobacterales bacterium]|nr:MAG: hypothetical protein DLM73_08720 [Chthoniobacterales bacterium]
MQHSYIFVLYWYLKDVNIAFANFFAIEKNYYGVNSWGRKGDHWDGNRKRHNLVPLELPFLVKAEF